MSDDSVLFEVRGQVAWVTLNRPKAMNALNIESARLMSAYFAQAAADNAIRVVVFTGAGAAFCTGADLKEAVEGANAPPGEPNFFDHTLKAFGLLRNMPKPVIIALNGITMAGGLEFALCGDIIIAAAGTQIGDGHANFGVYPGGGGASILPRKVPQNVANYLLLTGKTMTAEALMGYGLVNEVVPAEDLQAHVQTLGESIASKSPASLRRMKEVAITTLDRSRDDALRHDLVQFNDHWRSYDLAEGLQAFAEKRKPVFKGY
jgi:enoyl-CoA hydratase